MTMYLNAEQKTQHVVVSESELLELPSSAYDCNICGLKVKTKANLRAHQIKTHKIVRNERDVAFFSKQKNNIIYVYHCPVTSCRHSINGEGGFSIYSRLKQHYQHVHMLKTYQCSKCNRSFPTPSLYTYHQRSCGLTFVCPVCSRSYSYRKHLMQHFRRTGHKEASVTNCNASRTGNISIQPNLHANVQPEVTSTALGGLPMLRSNLELAPFIVPLLIFPITVPGYDSALKGIGVSDTSSFDLNRILYSGASLLPSVCPSSFSERNLQPFKEDTPKPYSILATDSNLSRTYFGLYGPTQPPNFIQVEASTQTDVSNLEPRFQNQACQSHEVVSVNTCTDEDDITSFIGSLFCNASVNTNFSPLRLNQDLDDSGPQTVPNSSIPEQFSESIPANCQSNQVDHLVAIDDHSKIANHLTDTKTNFPDDKDHVHSGSSLLYGSVNSSTETSINQPIQTNLLSTHYEHIAMQTDLVQEAKSESDSYNKLTTTRATTAATTPTATTTTTNGGTTTTTSTTSSCSDNNNNHIHDQIMMNRATFFDSSRMLETPPPPRPQSNVSLGTHSRMGSQTLNHLLCKNAAKSDNDACFQTNRPISSSPLNSFYHSSVQTLAYAHNPKSYDPYDGHNSSLVGTNCFSSTSSINLEYNTPNTGSNYSLAGQTSVGLQSDNWPVNSDYSHTETQTIDEDIELWLNSVETQTSVPLFDPRLFNDMCVGVDDSFIRAATANSSC